VKAVANGAEGLEALQRERFDVILMDCQMPVLDGFAATRAIREREAADASIPRTPIVALTAHALPADRAACLAAGMDGYLSKPFTRDQLVVALAPWTQLGAPPTRPSAARLASAVDAAAPPTVDPRVLAELGALTGDAGFRAQLVEAFVASSSQLAAALRRGASELDPAQVARAAHTLASSAAQVGGLRLAAQCKSLEAMARGGRKDDLAAQVTRVCAELERLHEGLAVESFGVRDA